MLFQVGSFIATYTLATAGAIGTNLDNVSLRSAAKHGVVRKMRKEHGRLGLGYPTEYGFSHVSMPSMGDSKRRHLTQMQIDGASAMLEFAQVKMEDKVAGQEHRRFGAEVSMVSRGRLGTCKVPKHGESVWGSIFGASERMCYDSSDELQQGEACQTACAKWYKAPYPSRVWCSCAPSGDGCTLQPVTDSADESPIMMSYLRCPISFLRIFAILIPCCVLCCGVPACVAVARTNQRTKLQMMDEEAKAQAPVVTSLTEYVFAGSTQLKVASQEGFKVGSRIRISDAYNTEMNSVSGFGSLIVATPLVNSYSAGASVVQMRVQEQRPKSELQAPYAAEAIANGKGRSPGGSQAALDKLLLEVKQSSVDIRDVFKSCDTDGDGALNIREFGQAMRKLGYTGDTSALFNEANWNSDETIDNEEFIAALQADLGLAYFPPYSGKPATPSPSVGAASKPGIAPLIFVHGIFGSNLANRSECSLARFFARSPHWGFLTAAQALGIKSSDISLPLTWQNGRQDYQPNPYVATGIIESLAGVEVYKPILDWLRSYWGKDFHEFAYDWRRDNNESADLLIKLIDEVVERSGGLPPIIVAHSNGGLVTMAALNERSERIHSVVFLAAVLGPNVAVFNLLHEGRTWLPPTSACSHPSYYCYLASHPDAAAGGATPWSAQVDPDGTKIFWNPYVRDPEGNDLNLMDGSVWEKYKLGALWKSASENDYDLIRAHLSNVLAAAEKMRTRVAPRSDITYPPLCAVESKSHTTICSWVIDHDGNRKVAESGPGDGRVAWGSGRPGGGINCPVIESMNSHGAVPNDLHVVSRALLEVFHERELRCSKSGTMRINVPRVEEVQLKEPGKCPLDQCNIL